MYRVIFKHKLKEGQLDSYVAQWQKGSDIIQQQKGALGTKLFRKPDEPDFLYAMADWESKDARNKAIQNIKDNNPDAEAILHKHEQFLESHITFGEFEILAQSNPSKVSEEHRQKEKEEAVLLALQKDMALIRKDLEIWGIKKDGSEIFISKSTDYDQLWSDALTALKK